MTAFSERLLPPTINIMNILKMRKVVWTSGLLALLVAASAVSIQGCTDLDEQTFGSIEADNFYNTDEEILAGVAPIYAQLRSTLDAYHNLSQVSSDETIVPTRGSDWFDNGRWLAIHRHTWDPSLSGPQRRVEPPAITGVARANGLLQVLEDAEGQEELIAELRALRAFYYYQLMDLFGGVPLVGDEEGEFLADPDNPPSAATRQETFDFIRSELLAVPRDAPRAVRGRLRADDPLRRGRHPGKHVPQRRRLHAEQRRHQREQLQLVRERPDRRAERVSARHRGGGPRAQLGAVHALRGFGARSSPPTTPRTPSTSSSWRTWRKKASALNFPYRALHYNQLSGPTPWNGFATLAETYYAFDEDDQRRSIFLEGQAFNIETGEPVTNRSNEPLIFTPEIRDATAATEAEGVRILKFPVDPDRDRQNMGNDYPYFRLTEMYLIKAEALNELSGPTAEAVALVNEIRARVFEPDEPISPSSQEAMREALLEERLFELTYEARRRQDMIRHGVFTNAWAFKDVGEGFRVLFPIPQAQIDASNGNLDQNPGYN